MTRTATAKSVSNKQKTDLQLKKYDCHATTEKGRKLMFSKEH